ncbi:tetrapyrrole-binding protein, chloroplastic [Impatiens glandulifera]|uniref:tetrapyrrole-binding protein, chloroplastic n=1 Tax=Impatiens glandulifera TaxID=253017 RepID=UPI001FB0953C|nr:tetrapyrrole-binding protein, chloroplastic [Impatiens glandulifera]
MATNSYSLRTLHQHHHHHSNSLSLSRRRRHHSIDCLRPSNSSSLFLNPTTTNFIYSSSSFSPFSSSSSSSSSTAAAASTVAPSSTSTAQQPSPISFDLLEQHLAAKNFRQADDETRRLLIALAGEASLKRGYVFFSEVQYIQQSDLKAIDSLWRKHSQDQFGYSVQKRLWEKSNRDFTKLFIKLGWMKKLDTEVEQYNYRSFPTEFIWELNQEQDQVKTPEGHLPLTNALRGTQLFQNILLHPAFDDDHDDNNNKEKTADEQEQQQQQQGKNEEEITTAAAAGKGSNVSNLIKRIFKPNYTF